MIRYHALEDFDTNVLLAIGTHAPAISFLGEAISYSRVHRDAQFPHYLQQFPVLIAERETYTDWTVDWERRKFVKTGSTHVTEELKIKSRLAMAKYDFICTLSHVIIRSRELVSKGFLLQEHIYEKKTRQAQCFKDSNYDAKILHELPYLVQYAEYASISTRQAADEILFKTRLGDEVLEKTELMRLIYSNKIRTASSKEEVMAIRAEFERDTFLNARLS